MVINLNVSNEMQPLQNGQKAGLSKSGKTLYAGNIKTDVLKNRINEKRELARNKAMKFVEDAWKNDREFRKRIDALGEEQQKLVPEYLKYSEWIAEAEDQKSKLMEEYGVDPDSQEQKDLELLEKFQNWQNGEAEQFSKEEIDRLKELQDMERTEYQNMVLTVNGVQAALKAERSVVENKLKAIKAEIGNERLDMLKSQDMLEAQQAADAILGAAEADILAMAIEEGKDKIEEKAEEAKEKQEKAEEKAEEREERIEEAAEKRKEAEEMIEGDLKTDRILQDLKLQAGKTSNMDEAQKTVRKIMGESSLIDEDLKGIKIDFNF